MRDREEKPFCGYLNKFSTEITPSYLNFRAHFLDPGIMHGGDPRGVELALLEIEHKQKKGHATTLGEKEI